MPRRCLALCIAVLVCLSLGAALACACQSPPEYAGVLPAISAAGPGTGVVPTEPICAMVAQVDLNRALLDLHRLTGEAPICSGTECYTLTHRLTGSAELRHATDYLAQELTGLGYVVRLQDWSRAGWADRNVVARKPGTHAPAEEIYLVAHVDGVRPDAGQAFPAADDDASGTADLLELARVLSSYSFSRTLVLLFTTGEEQGTLGVRSYLAQLSASELGSIKLAVDVDMIGYDGNSDGVMELWHGGDVPSQAVTQMMSEVIAPYKLGLTFRFVVGCG